MTGANAGVSSREIGVRAFRHVVMWPLSIDRCAVMDDDPERSIGEAVDDFAARLAHETAEPTSSWRVCDNHVDHFSPKDGATDTDLLVHDVEAYAEMVFFHDFVQRILYTARAPGSAEPDPQAPMRMYAREDIRKATITYRPGREDKSRPGEDKDVVRDLHVTVDRLRLYLFRTGVAILAVEIAWEAPVLGALSLFDLQTLLDAFRRSYPHFVEPIKPKDGESPEPPGFALSRQIVDAVFWQDASGQPAGGLVLPQTTTLADAARIPDLVGEIRRGRTPVTGFPPVFGHFAGLLPRCLTLAGGDDRDVVWRHVADERMPCMSWIALEPAGSDSATLRQISDSDWHRLCFVDGGGDGYFYDPGFVRAQRFDERNTYDRYRHVGTRYLFSGYAFTIVGAGSPIGSEKKSYFEDPIQMHFRRHYFAMGLLAVLEYASLLATSSRITRAVEAMSKERHASDGDAEEAFARRMSAIERDFLQYVHRYRFTGVSTQLQPMEMFARWRDTMGLNALYEDLHQEITTANEFLETRAARRQAEAAARQTEAALRQAEASTNLAVLATIGLAMGLPLAFFGMNVLVVDDLLAGMGGHPGEAGGAWRRWAWHAAAIGLGYVLSLGGAYLTVRALLPEARRRSPGQSFLPRFLGWGTVIATAATCLLFAAGMLPR